MKALAVDHFHGLVSTLNLSNNVISKIREEEFITSFTNSYV